MSNNYWDDEDDDIDNEQFASEGDLLKKLRKAKRADEKRIKELTEQLDSLSKVQRERTVKEVLESKGVNAKAARLILKDIEGDVSEEAVNGWLEDNAEIFGIKIDAPANKMTDIDKAALRQQDVLTQGAVTPDRAEDISMRMDNASSADELLALLRSQE